MATAPDSLRSPYSVEFLQMVTHLIINPVQQGLTFVACSDLFLSFIRTHGEFDMRSLRGT